MRSEDRVCNNTNLSLAIFSSMLRFRSWYLVSKSQLDPSRTFNAHLKSNVVMQAWQKGSFRLSVLFGGATEMLA